MNYQEFFRQNINVYGTPDLDQEQWIEYLQIFDLESQIKALDHLPKETQSFIFFQRKELVKKLNLLTRKQLPNKLFQNVRFGKN